MIGLAQFPGIEKIISFSFTYSHGISPSVCVIEMTPQESFSAADGDLKLTFDGVTITHKGCHIDSMSYVRDGNGRIWRLAILDRRWKWCFGLKGFLSGVYNTLQPSDGKIDVKTEKTPKELAELCLKKMGEEGYDISKLPNDTRPEINWDYECPAEALAALCDPLGCRVMLDYTDDKVKIVKVGDGEQLPESGGVPIVDDSGTVDPPERPDSLMLVGAPIRFQAQLKLEPVALEVDGRIVKLKDASYKPAAGWAQVSLDGDEWEDIGDAGGLVQGATPKELKKVASESVYRWYRVTGYRDGTMTIPGLPKKLERIDQIFPLDDSLVEQWKDPLDSRLKDKRARVVGKWCDFGLDPGNLREADEADGVVREHEYDGGFSIDGDRGLVIFSTPVVSEAANGDWEYPAIFLETSFGYRDPDTRAYLRYTKDAKATGEANGSGPRKYNDEGFVKTVRVLYDSFGNSQGEKDNLEELDKRADAFLKEVGAEYQIKKPREMKYSGLIEIKLDGAIQQVMWESRVEQGCFTRASRNTEFSNYIPGYKERRRLEDNRGQAADRNRIAHFFRDRGPRDA